MYSLIIVAAGAIVVVAAVAMLPVVRDKWLPRTVGVRLVPADPAGPDPAGSHDGGGTQVPGTPVSPEAARVADIVARMSTARPELITPPGLLPPG